MGVPHLSPTTLTTDEQRLILRATAGNVRDHLIFSMALGTGLRPAEIVGLDVGERVHAARRGGTRRTPCRDGITVLILPTTMPSFKVAANLVWHAKDALHLPTAPRTVPRHALVTAHNEWSKHSVDFEGKTMNAVSFSSGRGRLLLNLSMIVLSVGLVAGRCQRSAAAGALDSVSRCVETD